MKRLFLSVGASALLPLLGCASYPVPADQVANALANVRAAEAVGAAGVPQAALHLKLAQEEHARAKGFIESGDNEKADLMTVRANADAELAIALVREAAADAKASAAEAKATAFNNEAVAQPSGAPHTFTATTTTTSTTVPTTAAPK